jgi:acetyl-CoA synthetase
MLNVSGHLMSTAEVEAVLTEHPRVSEAAVVSRPHPVKGECLYCFITPNQNEGFDKKMVDELKVLVRERIGEFWLSMKVTQRSSISSVFRTLCST